MYECFCLLIILCTMCMQYPWRSEDGAGFLATRVTGCCELLCGCWDSDKEPLEEQPVLLTAESCL